MGLLRWFRERHARREHGGGDRRDRQEHAVAIGAEFGGGGHGGGGHGGGGGGHHHDGLGSGFLSDGYGDPGLDDFGLDTFGHGGGGGGHGGGGRGGGGRGWGGGGGWGYGYPYGYPDYFDSAEEVVMPTVAAVDPTTGEALAGAPVVVVRRRAPWGLVG